jgi:hypothetical protein
MLPVAKDTSKLLVGIPKGAWVALSSDQERVVARPGATGRTSKIESCGRRPSPGVGVPEDESILLV